MATYEKSEVNRKYKLKQKGFLLKLLGGKCVGCGISDYDVLHMDHINDDGYATKDNRGIATKTRYLRTQDRFITLYKELQDEFFKTFQILCANCNNKKEVYRRELKRLERWNIPPF